MIETVPGARVELSVRLDRSPVELGTIVVEGKRTETSLRKNGFYDRERAGWGKYFDPDILEHYGGTLGAIIREVPGVTVENGRFGGSLARGRRGCLLSVYLDGQRLRWANDPELGFGSEDIVSKQELFAIEVYPRWLFMPSTLSGKITSVQTDAGLPSPVGASSVTRLKDGQTGECGAIVMWTKPFQNKDAAR